MFGVTDLLALGAEIARNHASTGPPGVALVVKHFAVLGVTFIFAHVSILAVRQPLPNKVGRVAILTAVRRPVSLATSITILAGCLVVQLLLLLLRRQ